MTPHRLPDVHILSRLRTSPARFRDLLGPCGLKMRHHATLRKALERLRNGGAIRFDGKRRHWVLG